MFKEIADHDTELEETAVCNDKRCHQDTTAPKQEGAQNGAMKSTTVMRLRHLQPHVYDTPDFEKKFSTTNSRDGLVTNSIHYDIFYFDRMLFVSALQICVKFGIKVQCQYKTLVFVEYSLQVLKFRHSL